MSVPQALLSRLENGLVDADEDLMKNAAKVFELPEEFFRNSGTIYGPPVSVHTMLRGKKSAVSARDVDMITAELNIRLFHLRWFLENVEYRSTVDVPSLDVDRVESIDRIAATVRAHWKVPSGPVGNMTLLLERAGVIVGFSDLRGAAVSGVTFSVPGRPPLILINVNHPADRIRFTLAHELGHLVMHDSPTVDMEDQANEFASAFLLPPHELEDALGGRRVTVALLATLKREWRVSMQGILTTAQKRGYIRANQSRYLWQQISSRGWRMKEPVNLDFPIDPPSVLPAIMKVHEEELGFSKRELIEICGVGEIEFDTLYGIYSEKRTKQPRLRIVN